MQDDLPITNLTINEHWIFILDQLGVPVGFGWEPPTLILTLYMQTEPLSALKRRGLLPVQDVLQRDTKFGLLMQQIACREWH